METHFYSNQLLLAQYNARKFVKCGIPQITYLNKDDIHNVKCNFGQS